MSNHRMCCCGCNSLYRVFVPCTETEVSVDVRRAATTVVALDSEYGTAAWEGVVYLYNGACGCDEYCGTWQCDSRADVEDINGDKVNICTAVPCDAEAAAYPCPTCTDTELPFINVRPSDLLSRFDVIENPEPGEEDCCDPRCPNDCLGEFIDPTDGTCSNWDNADFIWHTPVITGPANIIMNGVDGQVMTYSVGGATLAKTYIDSANSNYRYFLLDVSYSWTMDISNMASPGLCTDESPPKTTGSGNFFYSVYQSVCSTKNVDGTSCLVVDGTGGFGAVTSTLKQQVTFEWPVGSGDFFEAKDDSYVCWVNRGFGNERYEFWHPQLTTNASNVPTEYQCARFGTKVSSYFSHRLKYPFAAGYPFFLDATEELKLQLPANLFEVQLSVTYPASYTP